MDEVVEVCPSSPKRERAKLQLSSSPPPNCAICLSDCNNKSFTDRCMHQFCFACLLQWSKVKAECPLCKQPFKSIIHNVRSNSDYEEHVIITQPPPSQEEISSTFFDSIPVLATIPRRSRFQFRTTLVLDPQDEIAIHQMLLSHPLTNSIYIPSLRYPDSVDFRTTIYQRDLWVNSTADVTGRYRDCSPQFFRENQAQRHRITPWLHRELRVLLNHNVPHVMYVMSIINDLLLQYHVTSPEFRTRLHPYFGDRTDHFIHEFHNFLRSPYDMIGYGRYSTYTQRVHNIEISSVTTTDSDSDVQVIATQQVPRPPPIISSEVIEISDSDSYDSDVIIREPTPPPIYDLVASDDEEVQDQNKTEIKQIVNNISETVVDLKKECSSSSLSSSQSCDESDVSKYTQYNKVKINKKCSLYKSDNNSSSSTRRKNSTLRKRNKQKRYFSDSSSDSSDLVRKRRYRKCKKIKKYRRSSSKSSSSNTDSKSESEYKYKSYYSNYAKPSTSKCQEVKPRRLKSVIVKASENRSWFERPDQSANSDTD